MRGTSSTSLRSFGTEDAENSSAAAVGSRSQASAYRGVGGLVIPAQRKRETTRFTPEV